jgi:hypothetical protein
MPLQISARLKLIWTRPSPSGVVAPRPGTSLRQSLLQPSLTAEGWYRRQCHPATPDQSCPICTAAKEGRPPDPPSKMPPPPMLPGLCRRPLPVAATEEGARREGSAGGVWEAPSPLGGGGITISQNRLYHQELTPLKLFNVHPFFRH